MNTTYFYNGSGTTGAFLGSIATGTNSITYWFALTIKYGTFLEAQNFNVLNFTAPVSTSTAPVDLPSLDATVINPEVVLWKSGPNSKTALTLVGKVAIQDIDTDLKNDYKGAVYLYQTSPVKAGSGVFYVNWSVPAYSIQYGTDHINVIGTSGKSSTITP